MSFLFASVALDTIQSNRGKMEGYTTLPNNLLTTAAFPLSCSLSSSQLFIFTRQSVLLSLPPSLSPSLSPFLSLSPSSTCSYQPMNERRKISQHLRPVMTQVLPASSLQAETNVQRFGSLLTARCSLLAARCSLRFSLFNQRIKSPLGRPSASPRFHQEPRRRWTAC